MATEFKAKMTLEGADKAAKDLQKAADSAEDLKDALEQAGEAGKKAGEDTAKGAKEMEEATDAAKESQDSLTGALDNMTGGAISGFKNIAGGLKTFIKGLKATRVAVAATGIGALVLIIGSLVTYFTKTEKGAEMLEVATASLGAVMGVLTDVVSKVGEFLVSAFTNPKEAVLGLWEMIKTNFLNRLEGLLEFIPKVGEAISQVFSGDFSGAAKTAVDAVGKITLGVESVTDAVMEGAEAVGEFANQVKDAAQAGAQLQKDAIALRKAQRDLSVEFSEQRAVIAELKKAGDDITLSIEERIKATEDAASIELNLAKKREAQALEAIRIQKEQMALSESTEEDYEKLAELEIALNDAKQETLGVQTELLTKVNGLYAEQDAKAQEALLKRQEEAQQLADLEEELRREKLDAQALEEADARALAEDRISRAQGDAELIKQIEEQLQNDLKAIDEKYLAEADAKEEERKQKEAEEKQLLKEALASEKELEFMALEEEYLAKLELARKYGEGEQELLDEIEAKKAEIEERYRKEKADADKKARDEAAALQVKGIQNTLKFAQDALAIAQGFNDSANDDDKRTAKQRFERGKKIQKASVIASTASAVIAAVAAPPVGLGFPAGLGGAATAAASGALQLRKINQMQFDAGGDDSVEAPSQASIQSSSSPINSMDLRSGQTLGSQGLLPQTFAPSGTSPASSEGETQAPIKAYVVSQDVSNAQELDSQLANTATL